MRGERIQFRVSGRHRRPQFTLGRDPFFRSTVRRRRRWPKVLAALLVIGALVAGGVVWQVQRSGEARARAALEGAVDGYLAAWQRSDWSGMPRMAADPPEKLVSVHRQMFEALGVVRARYASGTITERGSGATAGFTARLELRGLGTWTYRGSLAMARTGEEWRVRWTPATVHPALKGGLRFARTRAWERRAPILARDGDALTIEGDVVTVGVVPGRMDSRKEVLDALERYAGADPEDVEAALDAPGVKPDWFVPAVTLRLQRYLKVRPKLYPVPGIFFRRSRGRTLLMEGFAQHVVGQVDEATAEQLEELGEPYQAGDVVGQYGLEQVYERQLAGRPSGSVELIGRDGKAEKTLGTFAGQEPRPLQTTLDLDVQRAAEHAVEGQGLEVAMVALDARTGDIRAVANRPLGGANTAFAGHYPPGSTFKVVTGASVLAHGTKMGSPASCPPRVNAGGKVFRNFEGEALGQTTFAQAFAHSCNTAFIRLALRLPGAALPDMAETFGFGRRYRLPLPTAGTQFPSPVDDAERAAAAIGQGRVLATPLHMATVAGAAADGRWRPPRLVSTDPSGESQVLPKGVAANLRKAMRLVVTEGTGTAANVPGKEVAGKTGTAEFGSSDRTHAWFIGFTGHLAFAVLAPAGGVGGQVAAPVAARFLKAL